MLLAEPLTVSSCDLPKGTAAKYIRRDRQRARRLSVPRVHEAKRNDLQSVNFQKEHLGMEWRQPRRKRGKRETVLGKGSVCYKPRWYPHLFNEPMFSISWNPFPKKLFYAAAWSIRPATYWKPFLSEVVNAWVFPWEAISVSSRPMCWRWLTIVASLIVLLWEYLITVTDEVRYIWRCVLLSFLSKPFPDFFAQSTIQRSEGIVHSCALFWNYGSNVG
jgi:hypothetical protein